MLTSNSMTQPALADADQGRSVRRMTRLQLARNRLPNGKNNILEMDHHFRYDFMIPEQTETSRRKLFLIYRSNDPSATPSFEPSFNPTTTMIPSGSPSMLPSPVPSIHPSNKPSKNPSHRPSNQPSTEEKPTSVPSQSTSNFPSKIPSMEPSQQPSLKPSESTIPSAIPSLVPSYVPSHHPSLTPTFGDWMLEFLDDLNVERLNTGIPPCKLSRNSRSRCITIHSNIRNAIFAGRSDAWIF